MQKTAATKSMPSPKRDTKTSNSTGGSERSQSSIFLNMALDMSWRLALVVLVPIIGGFKLDQALGMEPVLTITGFLLAMGGMALVMWRTLQVANQENRA